MSASVNKVIIVGNLGREPEVRYTGDGKPIANLNVATTESWKDQSGAKQEKTEWHRVVIFGGLAEVAQKYLKKGDSVYLEGKMQTRKWTDNTGQDKYTTEVVVDRGGVMQMLGNRGGGAPRDDYNQAPAVESPTAQKPAANSEDAPFDDDIPF